MTFQLTLPFLGQQTIQIALPVMVPMKMTTLLEQFVAEQMAAGGSCDTSEVFEKFNQWKQGKVFQDKEYNSITTFIRFCWNVSSLAKAAGGKVPYSMKVVNEGKVVVSNIDMLLAQRVERSDTMSLFIGDCCLPRAEGKITTGELYDRWCRWLNDRGTLNPYNGCKAFITEWNKNYGLTFRNANAHIYNITLKKEGAHDYRARFGNLEIEYEFTKLVRHTFNFTAAETTLFFKEYNMTKEEFEQYRDSPQSSNVKNMIISLDQKGNIIEKWDGNINKVNGNSYQLNNSKAIWNAVVKWYNLLYCNNKDKLNKFSHNLEVINKKNDIKFDSSTNIIKLDLSYTKIIIDFPSILIPINPTISIPIDAKIVTNDIKSSPIDLVIVDPQITTYDKQEAYNTLLQEVSNLTELSLLSINDFIAIRHKKYLNLDTGKQLKVDSAIKKLRYNTKELICSDMSDLKIFNNVVDKFTQLISYHSIIDTRTILEKEIDNIFNNDQSDIKRQAITAELRQKLFIQSDAKCYCCESKIAVSFFELGHIIPHKFGGSTKEDNLLAICEECNDSMKTANLFEFMIVEKQAILDAKILPKEYDYQIKYIKSINQQSTMLLKLLATMKLSGKYRDKVKYIFTKYRKFYIDDRNKLNLLLNTLI